VHRPINGTRHSHLRMMAAGLKTYRQRFQFKGDDAYPELSKVLACIPQHCFEKNTFTSIAYLISSLVLTLALPILAWITLPTPSLHPLSVFCWTLFALIEGTVATGCWVLAHECGHGAFLDNKIAQDALGFILHSALLVPYFSWQRSHAVHHSRTNHLTEGESHVPAIDGSPENWLMAYMHSVLGDDGFAVYNVLTHLVIGWPAYLLFGTSGGPVRGVTNHFLPFSDDLFPGDWKLKVLISDIGVLAMLYVLWLWQKTAGSWIPVLVLYFFPYLVVNAWLVGYTWLQHTDVDIPHFDSDTWTWVKGAFATVDREYGPVIDFLHHRIGSTHVLHHICYRIPHYHAWEATQAIKKNFPELYLYDPTPISSALYRIAVHCRAVHPVDQGKRFEYVPDPKLPSD